MGSGDRRERERLALRARIMKIARRLFAEHGYDAVTMRMIAEGVEYSPRTLYLHFKDKDDLIWALCAEDFQTFGKGLAEVAVIQDPCERLKRLGMAYAEFGKAYPHHYRLMFMERRPEPDPRTEQSDPGRDAYAMLAACTSEAIAAGRLRETFTDPDLVAQLVWASIHGVVSLEISRCGANKIPWHAFRTRLESSFEVLELGLLKPS